MSLPREQAQTTWHTLSVANRRLAYTATAGTLHLRDLATQPRASVFYVSYTLDGAPSEKRPVTFCFNGGPGSSSVWLHLGAFGPKRVAFQDPQCPKPPPYVLEDNDATLLEESDLVFVDPVGTGFSKAFLPAKSEEFHNVTADVESCAEFVYQWLTRAKRWNSPRYLAGESYGSTRVARLTEVLQDRGAHFNGVVLISPALDFQALEFMPGNDLPSVLYLPSYAATAHYHNALKDPPAKLEDLLAEVREFSYETYAPALLRGAGLEPAAKERILDKLTRYTGLARDWIERNELRIDNDRFSKELLRSRGLVVGRLDSRFTGRDLDRGAVGTEFDPSYSACVGPFTSLINDYLRGPLGFEDEAAYEVLSMKVNEGWKWELPKGRTGGYLNVLGSLRRAMTENPHLRLFIANGLYDLGTPFFASEHGARHLGAFARERLRECYYDAGHMMYLHPPSRSKLKSDLTAFYREP